MSVRTEQVAIVRMYRMMVEELSQQAAVLHGDALAPVVAFMERQRDAAAAALQELDNAERERELSDVRAAYYGTPLHVDYPQDALWRPR